MKKRKLTIADITTIGVMVAVIEVCKMTLLSIPNVELTSFWIILFTLYFGWRMLFVIPVFILIEGSMFGFGIWWVMYLYAWPLLSLLAWFGRKQDSAVYFSILSGAFGLFFGLLCSIPYFFIGLTDGGVVNGIRTALTWWVAGIPWDIVHGISNFVLMMILYRPVKMVMNKVPMQLYER